MHWMYSTATAWIQLHSWPHLSRALKAQIFQLRYSNLKGRRRYAKYPATFIWEQSTEVPRRFCASLEFYITAQSARNALSSRRNYRSSLQPFYSQYGKDDMQSDNQLFNGKWKEWDGVTDDSDKICWISPSHCTYACMHCWMEVTYWEIQPT